MTDTDPDMMRRQQNMDTRQTIEGEGPKGRADIDDRDGRDRLAALGPGGEPKDSQQDAVFSQNTRGGQVSEDANVAVASRRKLGGLVRRGRSLLGN